MRAGDFPERTADMARRFRDGETLQQIGDSYGLSRERVRQILARVGIKGGDGGAHIKGQRNAYKNRLQRTAHRERRMQEKYGVSLARWKEIRGDGPYEESPVNRYKQQRCNAGTRGIEWEFTLDSWWAMWEASGKWDERGRGHGYVMARKGDTGPYSPDNCVIVRAVENAMDYYQREKGVDPSATLAAHGIDSPKLVTPGKSCMSFDFALALFPSKRQLILACGAGWAAAKRWEQVGFIPKHYEPRILEALAKNKEVA